MSKFASKRMRRLKTRLLIILSIALFLLIILPSIIAQKGTLLLENNSAQIEDTGTMVRVLNHENDQIMELPLETYVVGVVAAEMPGSFEPEALKTQALAARTYALKHIEMYSHTPNQAHPGIDLCTDPRHCQAWKSEAARRKQWGPIWSSIYERKINAAVEATRNQVITYNGTLIDPVYHSTCGGKTENSEDVWAQKIPYLHGVVCKWDQSAPRYQEQLTLAWSEIEARLQFPLAKTAITGRAEKSSLDSIIQVQAKSPTGRLKTLQVGNQNISATEFRNRLGLNSTNLTWKIDSDKVTFFTRGYGHGVGLCQYGANGQAKEGCSYTEIIKYYYQGVEIREVGH